MRPASAILPRNFQFWPDDKIDLQPHEVVEMYNQGFAGVYHDPEGTAEFEQYIKNQSFGSLDGRQLAIANGLAGSGEGRLILPYRFAEQYFPGCYPGAAQERGDCVSHDTKNAALITMVCDIASGKPDEVTGKIEGVPDVNPVGIKNGVLSTEFYYWYRGYNGDGWDCPTAAKVACDKGGLVLRNNYPDLGIDLSKYSGSLAGKYGRSAPPPAITTMGQAHLIRTATRVSGTDIRDYLANGYGISSCGSEGWSNVRDENGFSRRSGSWSHALAYIGYDDRDLIKEKYGEALILILNSWAKWNSGGRKILGTDILIPEGSFWSLASACKNRQTLALSGANGFPAKSLPPFVLVVG